MNDIIRQTQPAFAFLSPAICTTPCRALGGKFSLALSLSQPSQQSAILPAAVDGTLWLPGTSGSRPHFAIFPQESGRLGPRQRLTYLLSEAPAASWRVPVVCQGPVVWWFDVPAIPCRGYRLPYCPVLPSPSLPYLSPATLDPAILSAGVGCPSAFASLPDLHRVAYRDRPSDDPLILTSPASL